MPRAKTPTHESVQSKVNRLEDKMDARLDKVDAKFDKVDRKIDAIGTSLEQINTTLDRNTATLEDHVKRTNLLEASTKASQDAHDTRLKNLEASHQAIMSIPDKIMKLAKWMGTLTALISLLAGIAHLAIKLFVD